MSETASQVARLYDTALSRLPDAAGLAFWTNAIDTGASRLADLATAFASSAEFLNRYGNLSNRDFVELVYGNTLGRRSDPEGLNFWTRQLDAGVSRGAVVTGFSESTEHQARTVANIASPDPASYGIKLA